MALRCGQLNESASRLEVHSQFGEDALVLSYFRAKCWQTSGRLELPLTGFYVDVGAHHPHFISNTWSFYKNGWSGINVEPTPGAIDEFEKLRPRDINLPIAIADKDGTATLYFYGDGVDVNNTLVRKNVDFDNRPKAVTIETMRLETLLDSYLPAETDIDFMSIDVEGLDLEVLESNNWSRYRPELVVAEHHGEGIEEQVTSDLYKYMISRGYQLHGWTPPSLLFRRAALRWRESRS
jgi:FkbM family methyltransferase